MKLADNADNSRLDRQDGLAPEVSTGLSRRYLRARGVLVPAVGGQAARIIYGRGNPALLAEVD